MVYSAVTVTNTSYWFFSFVFFFEASTNILLITSILKVYKKSKVWPYIDLTEILQEPCENVSACEISRPIKIQYLCRRWGTAVYEYFALNTYYNQMTSRLLTLWHWHFDPQMIQTWHMAHGVCHISLKLDMSCKTKEIIYLTGTLSLSSSVVSFHFVNKNAMKISVSLFVNLPICCLYRSSKRALFGSISLYIWFKQI